MRGNASARIGNADPRRKEVRALRSRGEIVPPLRGSGDAGTPRRWRGAGGILTRRGAEFPSAYFVPARGGRLGRVFPRARIVPAGRLCRLSEARRTPAVSAGGRLGRVPARGGFVSAFRASRERAPEARHNPKNPMREHGEKDSPKEKKASERRHNSFRSRGAGKKCGRDAQKISPKMCLRGHFFFLSES